MEEGSVEAMFEVCDISAEGGLVDIEYFCGFCEAPDFCDESEDA